MAELHLPVLDLLLVRSNPLVLRCLPAIPVAAPRCHRLAANAASSSKRKRDFSVEQWTEEDLEATAAAPTVVTSMMSFYNAIAILEVPRDSPSEFAGARLLLLDQTGNVHSIYKEDSVWVGSYWDEFSSLPPIIPRGPIAILGLGGGTAARLLLHLWPERELIGWEIDEILIDKARDYLGLSELEGKNKHGGGLTIHVDDALSDANDPEGGFAGIVVDLFSNGDVLPVLKEAQTWLKLRKRLRPGGRIMINCVEEQRREHDDDETLESTITGENHVLYAMSKAFPGEVNWRKLDQVNNKMAFTGPLPNLTRWSQAVPERPRKGTLQWKAFIL
ncbi:uncharacterized protein LOC112349040 [Selaginella moellendorffii]|uniref:uncharacterized protein LOC112349040 n=1 Tax=Selaginella moellendorffii TaxID=88036 RepID=UPI000D1CD5D5|nr:uncharacterized protein LOC112349040 [Selaginella moellendorffii]|eukprot:XP_024538393.1 uncharacterized protein LOC112349040 [Selaginella moellendorffii]